MGTKLSTVTGSNKRPSSLIVRQRDPYNLEMPFDRLDDYITPTELFYVRNHFLPPKFDVGNYRLSVRGAVGQEVGLSCANLRTLPARSRVVTLECAGNGRAFCRRQRGAHSGSWVRWAMPNGQGFRFPSCSSAPAWRTRSELVLAGADRGVPTEEPKPAGPITYARSIPRAHQTDVLLAYAMNGEDLSVDHGYPLRAIVPGYHGFGEAAKRTLPGLLADVRLCILGRCRRKRRFGRSLR